MTAMRIATLTLLALLAAPVTAQILPAPEKIDEPKPATPAPAAAPSGPLAPLAWLEGCWRGEVNRREFREHWLPLRGDLMLGASHTVMDNKTQDYEYLRLESRADAVWYVAMPSGKAETAWKLTDVETDKENDATTFIFTNPRDEFPQHLRYRRGGGGWLYAQVDGAIGGAEKKVIYPMRRVDCESGEFIRQ